MRNLKAKYKFFFFVGVALGVAVVIALALYKERWRPGENRKSELYGVHEVNLDRAAGIEVGD